jgi:hypothetical protein
MTWGTTTVHLRRMYTAVLMPQILFGCSAWYVRGGVRLKGTATAAIKALQTVQRQALAVVAGAFRTTARAALEVLMNVPPPELMINRLTEETCLRILASPIRRQLLELRLITTCQRPDKDP